MADSRHDEADPNETPPLVPTGPTEALSIIYGDVEYIDPDGHVLRVSNWKTALANYYEGCEVAGIPRPNGLLR